MKNTDVFKKILESEGMIVHTKEEHQKLQDQIKDLEKKLLMGMGSPIATVNISDLEIQKAMEEDGFRAPSVVTIYSPWRDTVRDIEVGVFVSDTDSHNPNYPKDFAIRLMTKKIGEHILNQIDDLIADNIIELKQQPLFHINGTEFRMKLKLKQFT